MLIQYKVSHERHRDCKAFQNIELVAGFATRSTLRSSARSRKSRGWMVHDVKEIYRD